MRERVVIVGGGLSGLTAAYELSRTPELRERFEVSLYQIGWRLGGKLASGRNSARAFRNEEHGLHIWFGFYQNAFRLLDEVGTRWKRPTGFPFASLLDGFMPESYVPVGDRDGETYRAWHCHFPRNAGWPSAEDPGLSGWETLTHVVGWLGAAMRMAADASNMSASAFRARAPWSTNGNGNSGSGLDVAAKVVDAAGRPLAALLKAAAQGNPSNRRGIGQRLNRAIAFGAKLAIPTLDRLVERDASYVHVRAIVETTLAFLRGVTSDRYGVLEDFDFDRLNHLDFREFLIENGARRAVVEDWSGIRGVYDAMFQYVDGDPEQPSFEAGTACRILLRAGILYRGAALWVPRAGMGELAIAPLYDVLRDQGVRVELFHELVGAEVRDDRVVRLRFRVQARTKSGRSYEPVFEHGGMRCWGASPDWEQLESGDALAASGVDIEAPGTGADDMSILEVGADFGRVVLALPLGTLAGRGGEPQPCRDVIQRSPQLRELCARASLAPSISAQLWSKRCLGAPDGGSMALGRETPMPASPFEIPRHFPAAAFGWSRPLAVWADMRALVRHEGWSAAASPAASYYLCGTWPARSTDPAAEEPAVLAAIAAQLSGGGKHWPDFEWEALHDDAGSADTTVHDRLRRQVVRVNVRAADLCDGAAVGTSRFRPEVWDTGLSNLTYCGTWTRTGINSTCVEAAVMSGMAAARAITKEPRVIVGERFLARETREMERVE